MASASTIRSQTSAVPASSTVKLELSADEARLLAAHLARHVEKVELELVHTDSRALQRELADDLERLRRIERRLAALAAGPHPRAE